MTGAVLDRAHTERFEFDDGLTLEEVLDATLRTARAARSAECPVCHARMRHTHGGEAPVAECDSCGSRLS